MSFHLTKITGYSFFMFSVVAVIAFSPTDMVLLGLGDSFIAFAIAG
jgi:hypothetical protein